MASRQAWVVAWVPLPKTTPESMVIATSFSSGRGLDPGGIEEEAADPDRLDYTALPLGIGHFVFVEQIPAGENGKEL